MPRHPDPTILEPSPAASVADASARRTACCCEGRGTCRSCGQVRKHASRLVENLGLSHEQAAARMGLTPGRVRLLVAQERDHEELRRLRVNVIPSERVRAFLELELARNPWLTRGEVASFLDMRQIDLDRQLGYEPCKNGKAQRHVRVEVASRLVIALGRAPHELDGC